MKRYKKIIILAVGNLLVLSACSRQPDLDAKSYVQSSLDAYYHGDYKDYANLLEISEKDAKKEIEEDFNESIQQQFDYSDNITDKGIADYAKKLVEVKKLAKYKVQDEKKDEDENYTVSVKVELSDVFQTLQQSSAEVSKEKIVQGMKGTNPGVFEAGLTILGGGGTVMSGGLAAEVSVPTAVVGVGIAGTGVSIADSALSNMFDVRIQKSSKKAGAESNNESSSVPDKAKR